MPPLPDSNIHANLLKRIADAETLLISLTHSVRVLRNDVLLASQAATASAAIPLPAAPAGSEIQSWAVVEKACILNALAACKGKGVKAAARLGIGKSTLYRKLREYAAEDSRI
jgi:transcriptional regulator of acetoin/glycerol metabolism